MKKFLSLALALIMTLSLVTISAGATEYKDLTDKDEIQYEEAVAVLNRLGIITGYSDGSFRPEGELTRGAAAKVIASLMIGPEAAENLTVSSAPYTDVPVDNNFAAVINYCKTANFISGYGDGTFRPNGKLTGYAFSKMLLGALGYKSAYEGFEGAGWNMKVAAIGNEAHLFDSVSFKGNEKITRDVACQLALNTLKATMVEYNGGMNVTNGNQSVVVNPTRSYKFSNQEFARHINNKKASNTNNVADDVFTVEFGEEHFVDLRMDHDRTTNDAFGRPANEWSYKKVTIGTFPIEPDYVFTAQTSHLDATDAAKNRATGLGNLKLDDGEQTPQYTNFWLNGEKVELDRNGKWQGSNAFGFASNDAKVADISDLTDNGAIVEVYVDDDTANWIRDVVVIKTQLMEVRRTGSDYVALQAYDNGEPDNKTVGNPSNGFNQPAINESVNNIQVEDDAYAVVKDLKVGDIVAVVPVATDENGNEYDVAEAYVPEEVKGALSAAETYSTKLNSEKKTVNVTVGGTKYNVAQWSKDLVDIDGDAVKVTRKDVTLYLDKSGNAMLAKDVGSTEDFIIIGSFTRTMVDNRIVTIANGWDISGEPLELNLGASTTVDNGWNPGDLAYYTNASANHADWALSRQGGSSDKADKTSKLKYVVGEVVNDGSYEIKSSNVQVKVNTYGDGRPVKTLNDFLYTDKSVKFVYVNFNTDGEVDSVEVKTGVQNVKADEIHEDGNGVSSHGAQVAVKEDTVKAVVIKAESNDAMASNLMYIRERSGGFEKDENGNMIYKYTVVMMRPNEKVDEEVVIYSDDNVREDTFVAYTAKEHSQYSNFYDLRDHSSLVNRTTATYQAELASIIDKNGSLIVLGNYDSVLGDNKPLKGNETTGNPAVPEVKINTEAGAINTNGGVQNIVRIRNAEIVDLRYDAKTAARDDREINSIDDLEWFFEHKLNVNASGDPDDRYTYLGDNANAKTLQMQLVLNDNPNSDYFRDVALIVITDVYGVNENGADELKAPASTDASLSLTIDGTNISFVADTVNKGEYIADYNFETGASTAGVVGKTHKNASVAVGGTATATITFTDGETAAGNNVTLVDDRTLIFTVTAQDGSSVKYTVTLNEVNSSVWNNDFVTENYAKDETDATMTGYNAGDWTNQDNTNITVAGSGALTNPAILNTGDVDDIKAQVESSLTWLGYTGLRYLGVTSGTTLNWEAIQTTDTGAQITKNLSFDYDQCKKVVKVDSGTGAVSRIVAYNTALGAGGLALTQIAKETTLEGDVAWYKTADLTAVVNAGSTYKAACGAVLTAGTDTLHNLFDVSYAKGSTALTAGTSILEVDDVITVTLTAKGAIDLTPATTALSIAIASGADGAPVCSDATKVDGTPTATSIAFIKGTDAGSLAKDATITFTVTVKAADVATGTAAVNIPNITVTAPAA